jgi:hypothetical protein
MWMETHPLPGRPRTRHISPGRREPSKPVESRSASIGEREGERKEGGRTGEQVSRGRLAETGELDSLVRYIKAPVGDGVEESLDVKL